MFRRLTAILILLVVCAACIAVDAAIAVSPGQLTLRLQGMARDYLAAPFEFKSVRFSSSDGLVVRGVRIGDPEKPSLSVEAIKIGIDLYQRKVTKIVIQEPGIFLQVAPDGSTSFDNLMKPQTGQGPSSVAGIPPIELNRGKINAEIAVSSDETIKVAFRDIEASMKPVPGKTDIAISMMMHNDRLGDVSVGGALALDLKTGLVQICAREVDIGSLGLALPADGRKILSDLQAAGRANLDARLELKDGKLDFKATAECFDCSVKYVELPAPVEGVRGTLRLDSRGMELAGFSGRTYGNPVTLQGIVTFLKPLPRIELEIEARDLVASDELLAVLPEEERGIIRDFDPRGSADIKVHVLKPRDTYSPLINVQVVAKGKASVAYVDFPYRLENLAGTLRITPEKVEISNITSVTGSQVVSGNGRVIFLEKGIDLDVRIKGGDVRIDGKLRAVLAEEDREVWDFFKPSGTANLEVGIASPAGSEDVDVSIDVLLDGLARIVPESFPLPISGITGMFSVTPDGTVRLTDIRGRAAGGEVVLADTEMPPGKTSAASVDAVFSGVGAGPELIGALAAATGEDLKDLSAGGGVSGEIHLRRPEGSEDFTLTGKVFMRDGWLLHESFPLRAEKLEGMLLITPVGYYLRSLRGEAAGGRLEAWGELLDMPDGERKLRLRVEGFDILANDDLKKSLPEDLLATWKDFKPYGRADAAVWLDGFMPLENMSKTLNLHMRDVSGTYVDFPYPVSGVTGDVRVDVDTGNVKIRDLRTSDGKLSLKGTVTQEKNRMIADLFIEVDKIELDRALRDAMPDEVKMLWQDIELKGSTSGTVKLKLYQVGQADPDVKYDILLRPDCAQVEAGFPLRKLKGKVALRGRVSPAGEHILERGLIQVRNFTVNGLPVTWATAPLKMTNESLTLEPITGKMANGTLSGKVNLLFDRDSTYSGNFEIKEVSVKQAAEELFTQKMEKTTGNADAWIRFEGKGSDDSALKGKGELRLTKSNLWEVPFFSELIKALSLGAVPGVPFDESFGHFRIHGNRLVFTKAYFHSSVVNLDGAGSLFFDGAINFIFKIGVFSSIAKLDPTGIAHGILKRIEGELNAVEAKGTAKKVRLRLAPKTVLEALKLFEKNEPNQPDPKK